MSHRPRDLGNETLTGIRGARERGATLRQIAAALGVHVSTLCRWQARSPRLNEVLQTTARAGSQRQQRGRPGVPWHRDCPLCKARVVVRKVKAVPYWRCGRWPLCSWASWRPRHPRNCPRCRSHRFWSHSRRSVVCPSCGLRTKRPLTEGMNSG
jgi:hypothetical protein